MGLIDECPDAFSNQGSDEETDEDDACDHQILVADDATVGTTSYYPPVPDASDLGFSAEVLAKLDDRVTRIRKIHDRPDTDKTSVLERRANQELNILFEAESPDEYWYVHNAVHPETPPHNVDPVHDGEDPSDPGPAASAGEAAALEDDLVLPSYLEALGALAQAKHHFKEFTFLFHMGTTSEQVGAILAGLELPLRVRHVLLDHWPLRRDYIQGLLDVGLVPTYDTEAPTPEWTPPPQTTKRKGGSRGMGVTKRQRLVIPSSNTGEESAAERDCNDYNDIIRHMIIETRDYAIALGLDCFPLVAPGASSFDTAKVYGQVISARKGGGRVEITSLKQRWSRINRFFQAAVDVGHIDALMVCEFIDASKYNGFTNLLAWAGRAFGIALFKQLSQEDVLLNRMPGSGTGLQCLTRTTQHAPWLPDQFINYLADCCASVTMSKTFIRKAFFLYLCAVGGVRYGDAQHVISIEIRGEGSAALILLTASRFKATRRNTTEQFAIPLHDYQGRSLHRAVLALKEQMGPGFLLATAWDNADLQSEAREPRVRCSYHASTKLLRLFISRWQQQLAPDDPLKTMDFSRGTIHSFKGWLDTLCKQARVKPDDIDVLLHWSSGKMQTRYDRNPAVTEIFLRQKLVALLASDWWSAGLGLQQINLADLHLNFDTIRPIPPSQPGPVPGPRVATHHF